MVIEASCRGELAKERVEEIAENTLDDEIDQGPWEGCQMVRSQEASATLITSLSAKAYSMILSRD